jgi:uncharacterized protein YlxP (DUF503 family)
VPGQAYVVVLRIHLHFPDARSLKAKRSELQAIKAALHQRLGAALAEVEHQDTWQRSTLLAAFCGGTLTRVEQAADEVQRWLDAHLPQGAWVERRTASWSDLESIG